MPLSVVDIVTRAAVAASRETQEDGTAAFIVDLNLGLVESEVGDVYLEGGLATLPAMAQERARALFSLGSMLHMVLLWRLHFDLLS